MSEFSKINGNDLKDATARTEIANLKSGTTAAGKATKLATARKIGLGTGATGTATSFDGSGDITIPVTEVKESYLTWGGKNFSSSFGPVDAAMVPELGANRLAFMPAGAIVVEYSCDSGATWTTYGISDASKINFFNGNGANLYIGGSSSSGIDKAAYMLRITINTSAASVYTQLNKFVIYCSTNGSTGSYCTIEGRLQSNYTAGTETWKNFANKVSIGGWSGYNVINTSAITTYGNSASVQYGQVRFTFGVTSHAASITYPGLCITKIFGFGGVGWTTPSTMAKTGLIYSYDSNKNVTFPAKLTASAFDGNATSATSATKATNDASGNAITGYIKSLSVSGKVITYTRGDGTTGTITTQDTNTTYSQATETALGLIKIGYTASGKYYPVCLDSDGKAYVNVPWTDNNTTYTIATASTAGLVKPISVITKPTLNSVTTTSGKYYSVQMSSDGAMFVNVPWSDTNTDTHHTAYLRAGATGTTTSAATTNGNTYLKLVENSALRNGLCIKGSGATTVASDSSGNITINTPESSEITEINTQYTDIWSLSAGIYKLTYAGTKYLYYIGGSTSSTLTVPGGSGAVILTVNMYSTTTKHWYLINGSTSSSTHYIYHGYTTSSAGAYYYSILPSSNGTLALNTAVTTSANGLMSYSDKKILNGLTSLTLLYSSTSITTGQKTVTNLSATYYTWLYFLIEDENNGWVSYMMRTTDFVGMTSTSKYLILSNSTAGTTRYICLYWVSSSAIYISSKSNIDSIYIYGCAK